MINVDGKCKPCTLLISSAAFVYPQKYYGCTQYSSPKPVGAQVRCGSLCFDFPGPVKIGTVPARLLTTLLSSVRQLCYLFPSAYWAMESNLGPLCSEQIRQNPEHTETCAGIWQLRPLNFPHRGKIHGGLVRVREKQAPGTVKVPRG